MFFSCIFLLKWRKLVRKIAVDAIVTKQPMVQYIEMSRDDGQHIYKTVRIHPNNRVLTCDRFELIAIQIEVLFVKETSWLFQVESEETRTVGIATEQIQAIVD